MKESIIYSYNSDGFRSAEFNMRPSYISLGCSFTEGIGIKEEQTWTKILEKNLQEHVWNLGVSGACLQTCFRILSYYIQNLNIKGVFLLQPFDSRFEIFTSNFWHVYNPTIADKSLAYKSWVMCQENLHIEKVKCLYAMNFLCIQQQIPFVHIDYDKEIYQENLLVDPARDIVEIVGDKFPDCHPGPITNSHIAEKFYQSFVKRFNK